LRHPVQDSRLFSHLDVVSATRSSVAWLEIEPRERRVDGVARRRFNQPRATLVSLVHERKVGTFNHSRERRQPRVTNYRRNAVIFIYLL